MTALRCILVCSILAACAGGCSPGERTYLHEGPGVSLYSAEMAEQARLHELYVGNICRQAGLATTLSGDLVVCDYASLRPAEWSLFVQTGMNDIDARCDGYLSWLDSRRRTTSLIQRQLIDTQTAAGAVLIATQAGAQAISIVGAALGFAAQTFTNINSRLLFEVEQSTVQALVLSRQNRFRDDLPTRIDNKAAAIYALRSYLRLCMPMTIETQINTTVKLFERGGPGALADAMDEPLIDSRRLQSAVIRNVEAPMTPMRRMGFPATAQLGDFERGLRPGKVRTYRGLLGLPCEGGFTPEIRNRIFKELKSNNIERKTSSKYITPTDDISFRSISGLSNQCQ